MKKIDLCGELDIHTASNPEVFQTICLDCGDTIVYSAEEDVFRSLNEEEEEEA